MTLDPSKDFNQIIGDFEKLQADYEAALAAKAAAEDNERRQREAYFYEQQRTYEQAQQRDRRCTTVQKFIDALDEIVRELEWGQVANLLTQVSRLQSDMDFQLRNRILRDGK